MKFVWNLSQQSLKFILEMSMSMAMSDLNFTRKLTLSKVPNSGYLLVNFRGWNFVEKCFITDIFL